MLTASATEWRRPLMVSEIILFPLVGIDRSRLVELKLPLP